MSGATTQRIATRALPREQTMPSNQSLLRIVVGLGLWLAAATVAAAEPTPLERAKIAAANKNLPLVVLLRAEWCEPCNELGAQVLEKPEFTVLSKQVEHLSLDHDSPQGAAAGAELGVLGLPTAVVLRQDATGKLREVGRVEGFDDAPGWLAALKVALQRKAPVATCAVASLPEGGAGWEKIPCAIEALRGPDGDKAAAWLEPYVGGLPRSGSGAGGAMQAAASLARYWLRIKQDPQHCATVMAKAYPAVDNNLSGQGSVVYWHAKCLHRAGQDAQATAAADAYLARAKADPASDEKARLLVADLFVHEQFNLQRAEAMLNQLLAHKPKDAELWYLLARLHRDAKRPAQARAAIDKALALEPNKALCKNFAATLGAGR